MTALNLRAARLDILGTVGDNITLTVTCVDEAGDPIDVSSYTIEASVYRGATELDTFGDSVGGDDDNVITLSLSSAETTAIGNVPGLTWSLSVTNGSDTQQWLAGDFELVAAGTPRGGSASGSATVTVGASVTATITEAAAGGSGDLLSTNNLSDLDNAATARTNLGLGTAATLDVDTDTSMGSPGDGVVPSQQAVVTYVAAQIAALINSAPGALDTLDELAAALGDDENFAATVTAALATKADTSSLGAVATSNDYDDLTNLPTLNGLAAKDTVTVYHDVYWTFPSTASQGDAMKEVPAPRDGTIVEVEFSAGTAPSSDDIIGDFTIGGTSFCASTPANRPTIATSAKVSTMAGAADTTSFSAGDMLQPVLDQLDAGDEGNVGQILVRMTWSETIS